MEAHELIASLEARADQEDVIIGNLVEALKERAAAAEDLEQILQRHLELRTARAGVIVEAAFCLHHASEAATSRHLHRMLGVGAP